MSGISGLVPARFLTLVAHLILVIILFWSRDENVKMNLPENYSQSDYDTKDKEMLIGLGVSLGLFVFEFLGFVAGISMFMPFQSLLSICAHCGAAVSLSYFLFDAWPCDWYWYIFAFCSALPAVTEFITMIGVLRFRKG